MLNEIEEKNYRKSLLDFKASNAEEYSAKCRKDQIKKKKDNEAMR
jgi:hypothetical protein